MILEDGVVTFGAEVKVAVLSAAATEAAIATNRVDANVASSLVVRIFQPICFSSHKNRDGGCVLTYHSLCWGGKGCMHRRCNW